MRKKTRNLYIVVAVVLAIGAALMLSGNENFKTQVLETSIYDSFAQCVNDSGAKFYGAFWCPACNAQKNMFGSAQSNLPYVECSVPNGQQQNITCRRAEIESYPTWEFADGSRQVGILEFEQLAEITNCPLPADHVVITDDTMEEDVASDDQVVDESTTSTDEDLETEASTSTGEATDVGEIVENS